MSGVSGIHRSSLLFSTVWSKVTTLDGPKCNGQPSLTHSASFFLTPWSYVLTKSIEVNVLLCLGSRESIDSSLFFWTVLTNFGQNGTQGPTVSASHLCLFVLLSSDRQGFLPKRLGVSESQGQICGLTAPSERSVLEYPLWLQGVPGRSPGAKCIVYVSFKHV